MARPPLTERRRAATRREIADVAMSLFLNDGFEAVGIDAIAREAGISQRTFYRYFGAKEDVITPVMSKGIDDFVSAVAQRPGSEDIQQAVLAAYARLAASSADEERRSIAIVALLNETPLLRARWLEHLRGVEERFVAVIQHRGGSTMSSLDARLTAATLVLALRVPLEVAARGELDGSVGDAARHATGRL